MITPGFAETNAIVAVLEQKSFTKAAKLLGLSPARTSELVRNLEERLGVRLVERTTRSVSPTDAGDQLLERLRPLLEDYRAAFESLNDFRSKPVGTIRLTAALMAAEFIFAPIIARFLSQYPEINLDLSVDRALVDIVAARFDAGIRIGHRLEQDMIAVRVCNEIPIVTAASPAYLDRRGTPATPQELTGHACMRLRQASGGVFPWRFNNSGRTFEMQVETTLISTEHRTGVRAAADGGGIIQLPRPYLLDELARGRLVPILSEWAPPNLDPFHLYYSSRRQMRPPLKVFIEFLTDAYRNGEVLI